MYLSSSGDLEGEALCFMCLRCHLDIFLVSAAAVLAFVL